jgi:S-DNA-T family DNA segregation ATPase FtsK/SpoIIIE
MARRRTTKRVLKPRTPSRVRKAKRAKKKTTRGHQHPELIGLGLVAFGLFLATVLWAGWNGGYVGGWIGDALQALIGGAAYVLPIVLVVVGGLMVGRSDLVDVRPFRTGLAVFGLGLLLTLGSEGGYLGNALSDLVGFALGSTGAALVGVLAMLAGILLLTGALSTARSATRSTSRPS